MSPVAWFETGKQNEPWEASWIEAPFQELPVFAKTFHADADIKSARLYICGLGLYAAWLNDHRVGNEYLTPGFTDYRYQIQYQTYDILSGLRRGENTITVQLGNGWYRGRFGLGGSISRLYGDDAQLIAEIRLEFENGGRRVIGADETWRCFPSPVIENSIYDGEIYDAGMRSAASAHRQYAAITHAPEGKLLARLGAPVRIGHTFSRYELITARDGNAWILDFGQNIAGWLCFTACLPVHRRVTLYYAEWMQDGHVYRRNLRSAKQEYTYISDGETERVRPRFTVYGFRYVEISGMCEEEIRNAGFVAEAVWSEMDQIGHMETSDKRINKLIQNTLWSQRGNFVDIPTDCPQRDERMGWTGDAQLFSATACYNMNTSVFYHKFLSGMYWEQCEQGGSVPFVVPDVFAQHDRNIGHVPTDKPFDRKSGSCAWGDAATIIPWNLYRFYGDREQLRSHYPNMKSWTDYILKQDDGSRLWLKGFHFADWLSLDRPDPAHSMGGTDPYFVASAYYYLSARLTVMAADALHIAEDARGYSRLSEEIKAAIRQKYFAADGRLLVNTQTAHALAINFGFVPPACQEIVGNQLCRLLHEKDDHLQTGLVGTSQLCPALTACGRTDLAYTLLFKDDYPSWLNQVNAGATTIRERWDAVDGDGRINESGMNSLNHYVNGAVVQWLYETMIGLKPSAPGFREAVIAPEPTERLAFASCAYDSSVGKYGVEWRRTGDGIAYTITVPFGAAAEFIYTKSKKRVRLYKGVHHLYE